MHEEKVTMVTLQEAMQHTVRDIYSEVRNFINQKIAELPFSAEEIEQADDDTRELIARLSGIECLLCV